MSELPPPLDPGAVTGPYPPPLLPPALADGLRLALAAEDGGPGLALWLGEHPELAAELARFLAAQRDLQAVLDTGPKADPAGTTVGGYELREEIGRGGMGVVYRAYDPVLRREVALKRVLAGPLVTADELARFRFEAEAAASLDHPNIVPVFGVGEAGGTPFLVMPLMAGGSMARWLKALGPDRRLPPKEAARLVRDIARAVHHAHQRGLLHRDLKPANILRDAEGRPHVADFGLARRLDVTMTAGPAGTAAYMAPEQARGDRVLTIAVDVHALGAILFEVLTGGPPFGTGEPAGILRRVAEEPAPSARELRPDVPRDLDQVCRRSLAKEPADRYPTAGDLADDLGRVLDDVPIDRRGQRVLVSIRRALGRRRETRALPSWRAAFWGAGSTLLALAVIQAAVLLDAPARVAQGALAYYLVAWAVLLWGFLVARRDALHPVEHSSMAIQYGMALAAAAVAVGQLWLHDGRVAPVFQPLAAVVGLGLFAHGFTYWGRYYLVGGLLMVAAAAMPLVPVPYWPGAYGLTLTALQVWVGYQLRRADREPRAAADRWTDMAHPPP
jgi:serine/threonine-protein kinase